MPQSGEKASETYIEHMKAMQDALMECLNRINESRMPRGISDEDAGEFMMALQSSLASQLITSVACCRGDDDPPLYECVDVLIKEVLAAYEGAIVFSVIETRGTA